MSAPFIYETARGPIGQPIGSVVETAEREAMDPDTYDWAYVDTVDNPGQGAANRVKVFCNNAIDGTGTTTYTWSFTGANAANGAFYAAAEGGAALSGGGLVGTDLDTLYAQFSAAGAITIQCALSNTSTNPADASKTKEVTVS